MSPGQNDRTHDRQKNRGRQPNALTRSYDSHGPEVRIRGTAQHVAEKYLQLARDAHTGNDPVAAENYLQHAEYYFRLIAAAQAVQSGPQDGDVQAPAACDPEGLDDSDDFGGLPDRFAPREQETQQILTNPTNVLLPTALQPHGQRQPLARRKV
jgi:hypothetical protein